MSIIKFKVTIKNVYGTDLIYPADNFSQAITRLKGTKTLSRYDLEILKGVGYEPEVIAPTL